MSHRLSGPVISTQSLGISDGRLENANSLELNRITYAMNGLPLTKANREDDPSRWSPTKTCMEVVLASHPTLNVPKT